MNSKKKGMKVLGPNCMKTIKGGVIIIQDIVIDGCFEESTLITTQAGPKMIKDLDMDQDQVWNPISQQWMAISRKTVSLIKGIAYIITTAKGSVTVTDNHPFMTLTEGLVQASELSEGDVLANGDAGDVIMDVTAFAIDDHMVVHNLVFENAGTEVQNHFVEANGVVSGVLFLQDKIQYKSSVALSTSALG